ncbi:MAG: c-type cytochrome [Deltaproteobacteria bacterium]|nr:c-type cytochrome [Deltaproteobacteria bacterium]
MERWLVYASLVLTLILGWAVWADYNQEWTTYQQDYYRLALRLAKSDAEKEWATGQRLEIKQIQPKDLGTVERCMTCHLAVEGSTLGDLPQPLRKHPAILETHPPQRFGCIVCHGGEGRGVTTLEAHGHGDLAAKPLVKREYMQAACYACHGENTLPPKAIAAVLRGKLLINRSMCLGCHQINGEGGDEGPDLSTVGSHRNWLWLYAHLARPQGVVAGSTMPVFRLAREEIRDITIYLMTLLDSRDRLRMMAHRARRVAKPDAPGLSDKGETKGQMKSPNGTGIEQFQYSGKALFRGAGCSLCHLIEIKGGEVGPALTYIARKRKPEDLEDLLKDPDKILPGGKMAQLYLNEPQVKALVSYLTTLR